MKLLRYVTRETIAKFLLFMASGDTRVFISKVFAAASWCDETSLNVNFKKPLLPEDPDVLSRPSVVSFARGCRFGWFFVCLFLIAKRTWLQDLLIMILCLSPHLFRISKRASCNFIIHVLTINMYCSVKNGTRVMRNVK